MQNVAVLGLGIMGGGLAQNLLAKGFPLAVWNRTREKAETLGAGGARIAETPGDAVKDADVVIAVLGDDVASRAVWLGEDGALAHMKPGAILVECSTLSPDWVGELASLARETGHSLIDAPMAGSRAAAANAQIALFVGGDAATIEAARPALEAISSRVVVLGETGAGASWKLINNMMIAVHTAALAEAVALAEAMGMDMSQVVPMILNGAGASMIVQNKLPRMMEHRYDDTDFALQWMQKDARYAIAMGRAFGIDLKTVQAAHDDFARASDAGMAEQDFAAVVEGLRKTASD